MRLPISLCALGLALGLCAPCRAEPAARPVLAAPPAAPDPAVHYLFYLHGRIIEEAGRRPRHPRFGVYEYDAILRALQASGALVISEQRPKGTAVAAYAAKIRAQVERLIAHGVPASHIAVIGFSKGGFIAQHVSASLNERELRYVLLGACPGGNASLPRMHGKVLAIREHSDAVPSCRALFARATRADPSFVGRELEISIGGAHGAFYRPNAAWLEPALEFVR